jgi:hypothetical protein
MMSWHLCLLVLVVILMPLKALINRTGALARNMILRQSTERKSIEPLRDGGKSFQLTSVKLPLQDNPRDYIRLLHEVISEDKLIRWYIVKVADGMVAIDAVWLNDNSSSRAF